MLVAQRRAPVVLGRLSFDRRQGRRVRILDLGQVGDQIVVGQGIPVAVRLFRREPLEDAIAQGSGQRNVLGG